MKDRSHEIPHLRDILKSYIRSIPRGEHEELRLQAIKLLQKHSTSPEELEAFTLKLKNALYPVNS